MAEKLGAILVRKGLITQAQLDEALRAQLIYGGRLGSNLVELDVLDIDTLAMVLGEMCRYPVAQEADFEAAPNAVLQLLPAAMAEKHQAFPLAQEGRRLKVAMASPQEIEHADALGFITGLRIVPYVTPELRLFHFQALRYGIKRETRFIQMSTPKRAKRTTAVAPLVEAPSMPAALSMEPPPPAPVRAEPEAEGMFGGLAPGQYLSGDDPDAEVEDAGSVRWAPPVSGSAHPLDHLPPPAPPVAMIDFAEDGEMRVVTPEVLVPPTLTPQGQAGARPAAPPRLTPTETPRVVAPPAFTLEPEPAEEIDLLEDGEVLEEGELIEDAAVEAEDAPGVHAGASPAVPHGAGGGSQPPGLMARQGLPARPQGAEGHGVPPGMLSRPSAHPGAAVPPGMMGARPSAPGLQSATGPHGPVPPGAVGAPPPAPVGGMPAPGMVGARPPVPPGGPGAGAPVPPGMMGARPPSAT
ncbi:hypothetical protein ACLEPN_38485, partial [Myxococcus sp. 1LA]